MNKKLIAVFAVLLFSVTSLQANQTNAESSETTLVTEVAVMGMIHSAHLKSEKWGLSQVESAIRAFKPDVILCEIPPDRWEQVWEDWSDSGVIEDSRVKRFPEYTNVLLPLKSELGFAVEPCAAWTQRMSDSRKSLMKQFKEDSLYADQFAAYERENVAIEKQHAANPVYDFDDEDPFVIHSELYDKRTREELQPYDKYLNDFLGLGGWTTINNAHLALIETAIDKHKGKRILITFGAGHKYMFLDRLKERKDITLLDLKPYFAK